MQIKEIREKAVQTIIMTDHLAVSSWCLQLMFAAEHVSVVIMYVGFQIVCFV